MSFRTWNLVDWQWPQTSCFLSVGSSVSLPVVWRSAVAFWTMWELELCSAVWTGVAAAIAVAAVIDVVAIAVAD